MVDILIIGAGPAGLTAAIYAQRAGLKTLVLEKMFYGGQIAITNEIENYPAINKITGPEFSNNIYNHAMEQGTEIRFEEVISVDFSGEIKKVTTIKETYEAKCVIIANGVERRKLGVEGEESHIGKGVSYCATCDGSFFRGKDVAVVGGGNTALEDALFLSNACRKVYLIHRRDSFRAEKALVRSILNKENVEILYDTVVTKIAGDPLVSTASLENKKTGVTSELAVSGVFVAIGLEPKNEIFKGILNLDDGGYIVADEHCATNVKGVYVAGDTRMKKYRQIITAAADGAVAALEAANLINTQE